MIMKDIGARTKECEEKYSTYIGVDYASGLNSASVAPHLAILVAGVEGEEVETTSMTFVSSNLAILYSNVT